MSNLDSFNFNAKQWLGDDAIMLMDWDVKAMHLHLICIAWQQNTPGVLPNNDDILKKWLNNPDENDWQKRIKPQILFAWKSENNLLIQEGLVREFERLNMINKKSAQSKKIIKSKVSCPNTITPDRQELLENSGFNLSLLIKDSSVFLDKADEQERINIWSIGVKVLQDVDFTEAKARQYLGKLIQEFGEKKVAEAVAQLSIKHLAPAEAKSYLTAILKSEQKRMKNRSKVAL